MIQFVVAKSATDPRWVRRGVVKPREFTKAVPAESVDQVEQILRQVDSLDPRLCRQFLSAVQSMQNQVDVDRVATMLQQGRVDSAIQYVNSVVSDTGWTSVAEEVSAGMMMAVRRMPVQTLTGMDIGFSVTNPKAVQFLQAYEGDLIRELTRDARASVMEAMRDGVTAGRNPLTTARDVRSAIGLTEFQTRAVMNYRRALERGDAGNALGRALRDKRFDRTVRGMRLNPLASEKIDQLVERYSQRYLKHRSETIGRTESIRAVSAGNHMRWKQMVADGKIDADQVTRTWIYTHDSKTRASHKAIPSLNQGGVGLDQPFDTPLGPLLFPGDPNGDAGNTINCRCTVFYRFKLKDPTQKSFHAVEGSHYTAHSAPLGHIPGFEGRHRAVVRDRHGNEVYAGARDHGTSDEAIQEARNHVRQHYMGGSYDENQHPRGDHGHWTDKPFSEAKSKKDELKAKLKSMAPGSGDEDLNKWSANLEKMNVSPEEFAAQMGVDTKEFGDGTTSEVSFVSGDFNGDMFKQVVWRKLPNGGRQKVATVERAFDLSSGTATHEYLQLRSDVQGKDVAKKLLAKQISFYEKVGIKRVSVHANIDVGGYAWAKYGFKPTPSSWRKLAAEVDNKIDMAHSAGKIDKETVYALRKLIKSDDPRTAWAIADTKHGKDLMLDTDWNGTLDLHDPDSLKRFNAYVRR